MKKWQVLIPSLVATTSLPLVSLAGCSCTNPIPHIVKIKITSMPTRTSYNLNDSLDLTGLVVSIVYSDEHEETTTNYETSIINQGQDPIPVHQGDPLIHEGENVIQVSYKNDSEVTPATFPINVGEATITDIEITTPPTHTSYRLNESFDLTGMTVSIIYSDQTKETTTEYVTKIINKGEPFVIEQGSSLTYEGENIIELSYKNNPELKKTFSIDVDIVDIEITQPKYINFYLNDKLDLTGLVVNKVLTDGTKVATTDYTTYITNKGASAFPVEQGSELAYEGENIIDVVYNNATEKHKQFSIYVAENSVTKIEVTKKPSKLNYTKGEKFSLEGLEVTATYSNDKKGLLQYYQYLSNHPDGMILETPGKHDVTISYRNNPTIDAKFSITVSEPVVTVTSIKVTTNPKTTYNHNETLDLSGMVVTAMCSDGTERTLSETEYTTNPAADSVLEGRGVQDVIVTYTKDTSIKTSFEIMIGYGSLFEVDTWDNVIETANEGLDALKTKYKDSLVDNSFIGLERTIFLNNKHYYVRVIGENHDDLANGNGQAALTFEMTSLLSDEEGHTIHSVWEKNDDENPKDNTNYQNSQLRANLEASCFKEGDDKITTPVEWYDYSQPKDVYTMLVEGTPELANQIKKVVKKVGTGSSYEVTAYNSYIFPLSYTESAISPVAPTVPTEEGSAYAYWSDHNDSVFRIKKDILNEGGGYWMTSPSTEYSWDVFNINDAGNSNPFYISAPLGVSFAFCI